MADPTVTTKSSDSGGTTPSERYLARLGRQSFLSLWSYSNLYTDESRKGAHGDGKELCDLLVVFGNHVLIFSDKDCAFPDHSDLNVAWSRWYRRAIEKSARQLMGAHSWIRRFPDRLFVDRACTRRFPIPLPSPEVITFHLIAVTRGSYEACFKNFGGKSNGSLILNSSVRGRSHQESPFTIGHVLPAGPFVHVLDEMTLNVVLRELDTVSDLVEYLTKKESLLSHPTCTITAAGEEQLVAMYLTRIDAEGRHNFVEIPDDVDGLWIDEGIWEDFVRRPQYQAKKEADSISYAWDRLIEHFIKHGEKPTSGPFVDTPEDSEPALRVLAGESRLARRQLARQLIDAISKQVAPGSRFLRVGASFNQPDTTYVFLVLPKPDYIDTYEEYREGRRAILLASCKVAKLRVPSATTVVGIATEPKGTHGASEDLLLLDVSEANWGPEQEQDAREIQQRAELLLDHNVQMQHVHDDEYPSPSARPSRGSPADRLRERERLGRLRALREAELRKRDKDKPK